MLLCWERSTPRNFIIPSDSSSHPIGIRNGCHAQKRRHKQPPARGAPEIPHHLGVGSFNARNALPKCRSPTEITLAHLRRARRRLWRSFLPPHDEHSLRVPFWRRSRQISPRKRRSLKLCIRCPYERSGEKQKLFQNSFAIRPQPCPDDRCCVLMYDRSVIGSNGQSCCSASCSKASFQGWRICGGIAQLRLSLCSQIRTRCLRRLCESVKPFRA
jgi:hypothetical protein